MFLAAVTCLLLLKEESPLVHFVVGDLPVIISAPHGGTVEIPECPKRVGTGVAQFVTVEDTRTNLLAEAIAKELEVITGKKPWLVVAKFSRKYADANRPASGAYEDPKAKPHYDAYHTALKKATDEIQTKWVSGLLVDVHGQSANRNVIYRGTQNRKTVSQLLGAFSEDAFTGPLSMLGQMEAAGLTIEPKCQDLVTKETPNYTGGFITTEYGSRKLKFMDAIQLEFGGATRSKSEFEPTAKKIAVAIKSHYDNFSRAKG